MKNQPYNFFVQGIREPNLNYGNYLITIPTFSWKKKTHTFFITWFIWFCFNSVSSRPAVPKRFEPRCSFQERPNFYWAPVQVPDWMTLEAVSTLKNVFNHLDVLNIKFCFISNFIFPTNFTSVRYLLLHHVNENKKSIPSQFFENELKKEFLCYRFQMCEFYFSLGTVGGPFFRR